MRELPASSDEFSKFFDKFLLLNENGCYPQILWISLWKKWDKTDVRRVNVTFLLNWLEIKREININKFNVLY